VDPAGIIRYDAYTRFFELGESELFRAIGIPYRAFVTRFGLGLPRRVMHMEFVSPPVLDERLELAVYIPAIGTTSMKLSFDIYGDDGAMRMNGHLVLVAVTPGEMRKRPWPEDLLELLAPFRLSESEARRHRLEQRA
jgi:acyl-CoA thioesterase FadM